MRKGDSSGGGGCSGSTTAVALLLLRLAERTCPHALHFLRELASSAQCLLRTFETHETHAPEEAPNTAGGHLRGSCEERYETHAPEEAPNKAGGHLWGSCEERARVLRDGGLCGRCGLCC